MTRPRILFVLHLPPPVHGASVVGEMIRSSRLLEERVEGRFINLSTSRSSAEIGKKSIRKFFRVIGLRREVRRSLRVFSPEKVYCTPAAGFPGILKDYLILAPVRRKGIPIICHFHNRGVPAGARGWKERLYRAFFRNVRVVLLSDRLRPEFSPYAKDIRICPNGIDPLPVTRRERGAEEPPTILFFSNLIASKGVYTLLEACRILLQEGIPFRCVFAGSARYDVSEADFGREVGRLGLETAVRFVGPRYGEEKTELFAAADLFVLPTRYPNESLPLVILEAMSASLPVVSTDEGAIGDLVVDGETGFVCRDNTPETLAGRLAILLRDASLRDALGTNARRRFREHYTRECFEERMCAILTEPTGASGLPQA